MTGESAARCLVFDPFAGIAGDMILGALVDLGLPVEWLRELVEALPVDAELSVETVRRGAFTARSVTVRSDEAAPERHLADVLEVVDGAPIGPWARETATALFRRLAEVEGGLHGVSPDQVHFHEVGAVDALIDVLGTVGGVAELGLQDCYTRPVAIGRGWIRAAHGRLPVPAPATLQLLDGIPISETDLDGELATPTGAALLATLTRGRTLRSFRVVRSGLGAGSRDPDTHPNCLRLILAEVERPGGLVLLQADMDDLSPEYLPPLRDALYDAGALDVWSHAVQMKKGRTGIRVEALVPERLRAAVGDVLSRESTTIGHRYWPVAREVLPRGTETLKWQGFSIRIKRTVLPDGHVRRKPEYEDIVTAARDAGLPPLAVLREVERELASREGR